MRANPVFCTSCGFRQQGKAKLVQLNNRAFLLFILAFCGFISAARAQKKPEPRLDFKVTLSKTEARPGDTVEIVFTATVPEKHHLYSEKSNCPQDDGPIRANFRFDYAENAEFIGSPEGFGDTLMFDETWNCSTGEFHGKCEFRQKVVVKGELKGLMCHFQGQVCDEGDGQCTLVEKDIPVELMVAAPE